MHQNKPWTHHRARVANAVLRGDDEAADEARRDLKAAKLEEHIQRVVDAAPPLTEEQKARLAGLLCPVSRAEAA